MSNATNKKIACIMGPPSVGKSHSCMYLTNPEKWAYLNTDNKPLPFKDSFAVNKFVTDPLEILDYVAAIEADDNLQGGILDTLTFLMGLYETQYVIHAVNKHEAWGNYGNFYKDFIHSLKTSSKDWLIFAHETSEVNSQTGRLKSTIPIKGAVGKVGAEADFTTILTAKEIPIDELEDHENELLLLTPDEIEDGSKRVFVTRTNAEYVGDKTRSPNNLWRREELYIDNDVQQVIDRMNNPLEVKPINKAELRLQMQQKAQTSKKPKSKKDKKSKGKNK